MKQIIITLCALLMGSTMAFSNPITMDEAKANAWRFFNKSGKKKVKGTGSLTLVHTITQEGENGTGTPLLYIFNFSDRQGFVITSADDVALPILGYSYEGSFSTDTIPANVEALLKEYANQITNAQNSPISERKAVNKTMSNRKSVDYLVKVQWNQLAPYNDQCIFDGNRYPTGCVATAMAQIMYYWGVTGRDGKRFRHGCEALNSYTPSTINYEIPALDAIDSFNWDAMDEGTKSPNSDEAKQAVAQLMRYCGQSTYMKYYYRGSSTSLTDALSGMKKFGYNHQMKCIDHNDFKNKGEKMTYDKLNTILYEEIKRKRPVLMGVITSAWNHSFVCDGYDAENNSFHLNWGWSGESDGYYVLDATLTYLDATAESYTIVTGIAPEAYTYAQLSSDGTTLTLYRDNMKDKRPGTIYEMEYDDNYIELYPSLANAIGEDADLVNEIVIDKSFRDVIIEDCEGLFSNFHNVYHIKGMENFDTSMMKSMVYMFENCYNLQSIDLSHFDTSNSGSMLYMFKDCKMLHDLDLSHIDTSNMVCLDGLFSGCSSLTSLDLSTFVINDSCSFDAMLFNCRGLSKLTISSSMKRFTDSDIWTAPCSWVGSKSNPCVIVAPSDFDFGTDTNGTFVWAGGYFHLPYPIGDVNQDGIVNIADAIILVDFIRYNPNFYVDFYDVNLDGDVNITDVINVINIILGK